MDLYPLKAQYLCKEEVILRVELGAERFDSAQLRVFSLDMMIRRKDLIDKKRPYISGTIDIEAGSFEAGFAGYGVELVLYAGGKETLLETSFDIVSDHRQSLRYGFVSDFGAGDKENNAMEQLRKYHINMVQFYDWSYRHDCLVSPESAYRDMMGKLIETDTVREKIKKASQYGMKSIAYGAVYAASKAFYEAHKSWAFFNSNQEPFRFIDIFYIMNIQEGSPWRKHLMEQYKNAMLIMGFSGIHMDTYGFPKTAFSHLKARPELVELDREFAGLIDEVRAGLQEEGIDPYLVFNNVGNWPVSKTAGSTTDAVYIEVWQPYERYFHIKQLIEDAKVLCENTKPVILAAYLEPFRKEECKKAAYAAYLLTAAIVSNGAYHLLLGENQGVLTQGYYGDYSVMDQETASVMRRYYDFMIRYMELFYDPALQDVTMTHIGWDNYEYQCGIQNWSAWGESGKVWITLRENQSYKCLYLINLCGNSEDHWNKGKDAPAAQYNIEFTVHIDQDIQGVYCASPDRDRGGSEALAFEYVKNEKGKFVKFCVPELLIWTLVYIKL